ncbi:uncharacterized protein EDB93DRAFT_1108859 [Suillus bovinus]|uniref:uncharacterized protein n=1 Tax=Suillus bovinus TaxID=48563 RepID=UPI001B886A20|nr:uncharacterized protein EDB93DRAFT_1108859 [Suillus bovinus]KAG2128933.1 hypothetical protein EDB93DRAFT_1108859 [Suillus bovinus]
MQEEMGLIKGFLERTGRWGVVIYDKDKLLAGGDEITIHASQNSLLHLVTILKKIKTIYLGWIQMNITILKNMVSKKDFPTYLTITCLLEESNAEAKQCIRFIMAYTWSSFMKMQEGIVEVCRWFKPLVDHFRMLHMKLHQMDDYSSVMFDNIIKDSRFPPHSGIANREIVKIIWNNRRTLMLRLMNCVTEDRCSCSPRPKDEKSFEAAYNALPEASDYSMFLTLQTSLSTSNSTFKKKKAKLDMMEQIDKVKDKIQSMYSDAMFLHDSNHKCFFAKLNTKREHSQDMKKYKWLL